MRTYIYLISILLMLSSCNARRNQRVIENKDELMGLSQYQDITCTDGRNYYELKTYTPDYKMHNQFIFNKIKEKNQISYTLEYDSIQFMKDDVIGLDFSAGQYEKDVCDYYTQMTEIIKLYGISALFRYRYPSKKPALIVYFEGGGGLKYYPDGPGDSEVFLSDYEKIAEGWYLW